MAPETPSQAEEGTKLRLLRELFLFEAGRRLPTWRVALYTVGVMALALLLEPGIVSGRFDFTMDNHAMSSLDRALNATFCGRPSAFSTEYEVGGYLATHAAASYVPLADVIAVRAGSVEAYCRGHLVPFVNEDNGLSLLYELLLRMNRRFSADGLAHALAWIRIAVVAASCALLLALGGSVLFVGGVAVAAAGVIRNLVVAFMAYSAHSFFFIMVLLNAAMMTVVVVCARSRRRWHGAIAAAVAGAAAAFAVSVRASYLPVYAAFLLSGCWGVAVQRRREQNYLRAAAVVAVSFIAGYGAFQYLFVSSRVPAITPGAPASTHHSISHPLVLGLAEPDNELARSEGIVWDDGVGIVLARRITPGVDLLGAGYDEAMFTYYRGLWRRYPRQMIGVYMLKLRAAGAAMIHSGRFSEAWMRPAMWPLHWITNGIALLAVLLASTLAGFIVYARRGGELSFYLALLCLGGVLLYFESALIMPKYYVSYHNYLLFIVLVWSALACQVALNGMVALGRRILPARGVASTS